MIVSMTAVKRYDKGKITRDALKSHMRGYAAIKTGQLVSAYLNRWLTS